MKRRQFLTNDFDKEVWLVCFVDRLLHGHERGLIDYVEIDPLRGHILFLFGE